MNAGENELVMNVERRVVIPLVSATSSQTDKVIVDINCLDKLFTNCLN